ncbi:MAG: hypothetical protein PHS60_18185, partial [Zavarzinia sp.]|nr:hypothetical protein [Zavarzinia sp.]
MRLLLAVLSLSLLPAVAVAEPAPAPPEGAAGMARRPGIVDRFLGAALGGPPYYNFMLFPIGTDRDRKSTR